MSDNPTALFRPVTPGRVSVEIVDQIKTALRDGRLVAGDRLPPERELTETFGVSRVTVRDALRVLETHGLIEIRVGAGGGAVITAPRPDDVADGIANMLMMATLTPENVTEARAIVEVGMLPYVCQRATEGDMATLREIVERAETALADDAYDIGLSTEFHLRLAQAAHNDAVEMLITSLQQPLHESLIAAKEVDPDVGRRGTEEHRRLITAIEAGDLVAAETIMREHVGRTAQRLRLRPATRS